MTVGGTSIDRPARAVRGCVCSSAAAAAPGSGRATSSEPSRTRPAFPGSVVGAIQINDGFSLVDIQEPVADDVGRALAGATIRGRRLKVHRDS